MLEQSREYTCKSVNLDTLNVLQSPVWIFDIENVRMWWANPPAMGLWDSTNLQELISRDWNDISSATKLRWQGYLPRFTQGEAIVEHWPFTLQGNAIYVKCIFSGVEIENNRIAMLCESLGEQDIDPQILRSVEAFRQTTGIISLYTPTGRTIMQNPASMAIYDPNQSLQEHFVEADAAERFLLELNQHNVVSFETRVKTKKGVRWHKLDIISTNDPVTGDKIILINEKDITDRVLSQAAQRETEHKYYLLEENTNEIVSHHEVNGVYMYISTGCEVLLGYRSEELIGRCVYELFHPEDIEKIKSHSEEILTETGSCTLTYRLRKKNGGYIWLETIVRSMKNPKSGEVEALMCLSRDISDRKRSEIFLSNQKQVLEMMVMNQPLQQILDFLIISIESQAEAMKGCIMLLSEDGNHISCGAAPSLPNTYHELASNLPVSPTASSCSKAVYEKQIVVVEDIATDPQWLHIRDILLGFGLRASYSILIYSSQGKILGTLCAYYTRPQKPSLRDIQLMETISYLAGSAIERRTAQEKLQKAEAKYRHIFENISQGIFQLSPQGYFQSANPALAKIYGYDSPETLITNVTQMAHLYVNPSQYDELIQRLSEQEFITDFEYQAYRQDGTLVWLSQNTKAVHKHDGSLLFYEGTVEDITHRRIAEEKLLYNAYHDSLTGLHNRSWLINYIESIKNRYAVLIVDLDGFKIINESLGHIAGDDLLKKFAYRLQSNLRFEDKTARLGEDEFAVLLENIKETDEIFAVAEKILQQLQFPFEIGNEKVFANASIGIALSNNISYQKAEEILRDADIAMYQAKTLGRGRYQIFDPDMQNATIARLQMANDLREAVHKKELYLYYQPIVNLSTGSLKGFEALVRWQHPTLGAILPSDFIYIAENAGLINQITMWVFEEVCKQLQTWQQQFPDACSLIINVNLSASELKQADLVDKIKQLINVYRINPKCLKLEITETCFLETVTAEATTIRALKDLGIGLCIDDFGTGYSSLSRLHQFPIDTLKIDQSFVSCLDDQSCQTAIIQTIIMLAHSLGMNVVAEGIESPLQLQAIKRLGCEFGQGFIFAKPVDHKSATDFFYNQWQHLV